MISAPMIVCVCQNVTESDVKSAIQAGFDDMHSLREYLGIGAPCGKCKSCAKTILRKYLDEEKPRLRSHPIIRLMPAP